MHSIDPHDEDIRTVHSYLLGSVAPRPIAFASTISGEGKVNLSPFSFFNVFSAKPPVMIFSPAKSGRTGEQKHSYLNVKDVPEVVINIVNRSIVEKMSLASSEYPRGINEFKKAGFTEVESVKVRPPRVAECPVQFECIVKDVVELGDSGGSGNLIICEAVMMHFQDYILDENMKIDIRKIDLVGRMAGNYYVHANHQALFEVPKPDPRKLGIGVDCIPESILNSKFLGNNDIGVLGGIHKLPTPDEVREMKSQPEIKVLFHSIKSESDLKNELHEMAHRFLQEGKIYEAWKVLLVSEEL